MNNRYGNNLCPMKHNIFTFDYLSSGGSKLCFVKILSVVWISFVNVKFIIIFITLISKQRQMVRIFK
jgi:hypothetical protein